MSEGGIGGEEEQKEEVKRENRENYCSRSKKKREKKHGESVCGNVEKELLFVMKWRCWLEYVRRSITTTA